MEQVIPDALFHGVMKVDSRPLSVSVSNAKNRIDGSSVNLAHCFAPVQMSRLFD